MSFSIGGLASGLDTKSIVAQLMSIEARPKVKTEWNKALWTERKNVWTDLNTRLLNLQAKANVLNNPGTWSSAPAFTSSDPTKLTATSGGPSPANGTYTINVTQVAAAERWNAANSVGAGAGGARQTGAWYSGAFTTASSATLLTDLRDIDGTPLGLDAGSTISMSASVNGSPVNANFVVGAGSTLDDLAQWAESNFPGATFTVNGDGTIGLQSAAGAANEITGFSFTATNSASAALPIFNGTDGASSSFVAPPSGGAAADTLTITQGATSWNVAIAAGATDADIMAAINGTGGIGVTASLVGGKLQLDSNATGAASSFTVTSAGGLAATLGMSETVAGQDSIFDVNGTSYTRATAQNINDVITDVDLDLLATTGAAVTLTIANGTGDTSAIKQKLKEFVDQYNAVIDLVNAKTGEAKVVNAKNLSDYLKGPMARDYGMSSVAFDVRRWTTDTVSGLPDAFNALDDIGITTGAVSAGYSPQNTSGRLVIDDAKLDAALAADPSAVKDLLTRVGGAPGKEDDGISRRISDLVSELRVGGRVDAGLQGASRQVKDLQSRIDRFEDRLERKRAYYDRMFSSLESTLGKLQSQGQWLSGQLGALSGGQ